MASERNGGIRLKKILHRGHRQRMRERYVQSGLDGFQTHEVLEMLLYRSIARGNTNPAAHALLDRCGSMEAVLEGKTAVPGTGVKTLEMLQETGRNLDRIFLDALIAARDIGRAQISAAAFRCLRRKPDGVFIMITDQKGRFQEMTTMTGHSPAEILRVLAALMKPDQVCHLACITDGETVGPLRKRYGKTILGWFLCLSPDWKPTWI